MKMKLGNWIEKERVKQDLIKRCLKYSSEFVTDIKTLEKNLNKLSTTKIKQLKPSELFNLSLNTFITNGK